MERLWTCYKAPSKHLSFLLCKLVSDECQLGPVALYPWDLSPCESSDQQDSLDRYFVEAKANRNWTHDLAHSCVKYFCLLRIPVKWAFCQRIYCKFIEPWKKQHLLGIELGSLLSKHRQSRKIFQLAPWWKNAYPPQNKSEISPKREARKPSKVC